MAIDVFLSVGRTFTPTQENFVSAVERVLQSNGLAPRTVGRSSFSSQQPLKLVDELMHTCAGSVIIAFERTYIDRAINYRGAQAEESIQDRSLPTVWNQIEAAMAYVNRHPLLVIVEHGLLSEGLLEARYDWYVQWLILDPAALNTIEFNAVFADWKSRVEKFHALRPKRATSRGSSLQPGEMTIGELIGALRPAQAWTAGVSLVAALSAVASAAYWLAAHAPGP